MIIESRPFEGYVTFATFKPSTQYCAQSDSGAAYVLQMNKSKSQFINKARHESEFPPTAISFIRTPDGVIRIYAPDKKGNIIPLHKEIASNSAYLNELVKSAKNMIFINEDLNVNTWLFS